MNLFKYGTVNQHSEELFCSGRVFFQAPRNLNDPFECSPEFTFNGTDDDFIEYLTREKQKRDGVSLEKARKEMREVFISDKVFLPYKLEMVRQNLYQSLSTDIGIYCLSERYDSLLMWAHYADKHQGFCIEFEANETTPFFGSAQKVRYSDTYPVVDFFNTSSDDQVDQIFLTKSEDWRYENEWRIVDHENGSGIREYPEALMKSVTFGLRMPISDRERISAWLKERGSDVETYEAYRHKTEFRVGRRRIDA